MKWLAACLVPLLIATLALACEEGEEGATGAVRPAATITATPEATASPQRWHVSPHLFRYVTCGVLECPNICLALDVMDDSGVAQFEDLRRQV